MKAQWQKDKQFLSEINDKRYSVKEEILSPNNLISYLEIANAARHDSALYTCIVSNNFGTDDTNIQLIIQGDNYIVNCNLTYSCFFSFFFFFFLI